MKFQNPLALLACVFALPSLLPHDAHALTPKRAPLMTRFAAQVDVNNPLPEYPRPQLVRSQWMNLNGVWEYQSGNEGDAVPTNTKLNSEICVPFPVESALSGVMEHHDRLWYRRNFTVPAAWNGKQLKLHFGAVDYEAEVFVNGQSAGLHRGGYEPFSLDITRFLKGSGPQELIVRAFDPTDKGGQPRGKQTLNPGFIMYTPVSGIWQTVWLEPTDVTSIRDLRLTPDVDKSQIKITVNADGATAQTRAEVSILDSGKIVKTLALTPGVETAIPLPNPKLWSPDSPFLYNLKVTLSEGKTPGDSVTSYFGMRKISVGMVGGVPKMLLNNKFVFQMGPLDQGYWPDGLYTAPTDEALKSDLEVTKRMGFNMTRKHIKIEPARWYYHADKLGLLVWQDMPSPNSYTDRPATLDKAAFEQQLRAVIAAHGNSPAIVMWVIFNENQARHDTRHLVELAHSLDPTRLVNRDSGGGNDGGDEGNIGDVDDVHNYPPPATPNFNPANARNSEQMQALACGEYGGIAYAVKGRTWKGDSWGYTSVPSVRELENIYGDYSNLLKEMRDKRGLSAAVYTQLTDVEIEINGLMTYDRLVKPDLAPIKQASNLSYPPPTYLTLSATAETAPQTWKYSFDKPSDNWASATFDDTAWKSGQSAFGSPIPGSLPLATEWTSDDIWARRTFNPGDLTGDQLSQLMVRLVHDDDVEVFINGTSVFKNGGTINNYQNRALWPEAQRAVIANATNVLAVHCHDNGGGQHLDVGIVRRIPGTN